MDLKEYELLGPALERHWYYVAKGRAMRAMLGGVTADQVLDVGAGSGVFARQLLDAGVCRSALCIDTGYDEDRSERHNGRPIRFARALDGPPPGLVLFMDVLEHVDDDVALLKQYTEPMPARGRVLVSVPAFAFLWSGHDVFLEHRRRYTRRQLEEVVRAAGLEAVRSRFFFAALFPIVAAMRIADRARRAEAKSALKAYPAPLNRALVAIHDLERALVLPYNRLAGLTLFCLARPRAK